MFIKQTVYVFIALSVAQNLKASCMALFKTEPKVTIIEQLFTSLEINRSTQTATRKYSVFDILRIRRDLESHKFIKNELRLPKAFIVPEVNKPSILRLEFKIPRDAEPLTPHMTKTDIKSKFDLALNLMMKQIEEKGYPWSVRYAKNYLTSRNVPKTQIISRADAKREILFNNRIIIIVNNSETRTTYELQLTPESFLYSPSTGQLIFAALY